MDELIKFIPAVVGLIALVVLVSIFKQPKHQRMIVLAYLFLVSAWMIWLGSEWLISGLIPIKCLGYVLGIFGLVGLFGGNIWRGGPLDPRTEQQETSDPDPSRDDVPTR